MLVDTFYNRIRTTQAVSRTFAIGRFSDLILFLILIEVFALLESADISLLYNCVMHLSSEISLISCYFFECAYTKLLVFLIFSAASCKCAQLLLFV